MTASIYDTTPSEVDPGARYGLDVSTFVINDEGQPDLDRYFTLMGGDRVLGEQLLRGILMEPGELWDAPDEGNDVRLLLGARFDLQGVKARAAAAMIQTECDNDDRVERCAIGFEQANRELRIEGTIEPKAGPPFPFVITIGDVTVEMFSPQ